MRDVGETCAFYCWCMICGVKVGRDQFRDVSEWESAARTPGRWTAASLLIQGPAWGFWDSGPKSMIIPNEAVKFYPADVGWQRLDVSRVSDDKRIFIQVEEDDEANDNHGTDANSRWYFVIHSACHDIATKVMHKSQRASIRSVGDLWMTLDRRCQYTHFLSRSMGSPQLPIIPFHRPGEPVKFGLEGYCIPRRVYREPHGYPFAPHIIQWWNTDPLHIPNITACLLANLEQHQLTDEILQRFRRAFGRLPQEITDQIITDFFDMSLGLQCTYVISQSYWKQVFLSIPFLWDLDESLIKDKLSDPREGYEWDWEKITRQLMSRVELVEEVPMQVGDPKPDGSTVAWSYSKVGLDVPPGLTNRRRIWQLLEDMYPNDVDYEQEG